MNRLKTFEAYSDKTMSTLSEINLLAGKAGLPQFEATGDEKVGKWYKDMFKSDIIFYFTIDNRKDKGTRDEYGWTYRFSIGEGKNKEGKRHYTSDDKYFCVYESWFTTPRMGGIDLQKIDENTKGFDNLESAVSWVKEMYDKKRKGNPLSRR